MTTISDFVRYADVYNKGQDNQEIDVGDLGFTCFGSAALLTA